ncbi:hypothetical protein NQ318_008173 [Aromia moschata]|uniref:THAP-type domain-containing protein n=1 Tax=Aromia moschata TaxID=1265417 RepID=A0AAV8YIB4_9CUCU|nr:hypothetical protein NQ318_008173 [Aromia moschata]
MGKRLGKTNYIKLSDFKNLYDRLAFESSHNTDKPQERIDKRKAWILKLRIGKPISKFMRVCSLHFAEEDFFLSMYIGISSHLDVMFLGNQLSSVYRGKVTVLIVAKSKVCSSSTSSSVVFIGKGAAPLLVILCTSSTTLPLPFTSASPFFTCSGDRNLLNRNMLHRVCLNENLGAFFRFSSFFVGENGRFGFVVSLLGFRGVGRAGVERLQVLAHLLQGHVYRFALDRGGRAGDAVPFAFVLKAPMRLKFKNLKVYALPGLATLRRRDLEGRGNLTMSMGTAYMSLSNGTLYKSLIWFEDRVSCETA